MLPFLNQLEEIRASRSLSLPGDIRATENGTPIAKKGTPSARVSAANALLDRAYGKPPQFNTSDATSFRKAVDMTDDELAAIAARAKLTVV